MPAFNEISRTIWCNAERVEILDQTALPHKVTTLVLDTVAAAAHAIKTMQVRGAPLIGVAAAYGVALAMRADASTQHLEAACAQLAATRPTAVNLAWALSEMRNHLAPLPPHSRRAAAFERAAQLVAEDILTCSAMGAHGLALIRDVAARKPAGSPINILTHCNAGWLAAIEWGTATAPIYKAHEAGIPLHVFVDETRPRNQGAALTAWELGQRGVPHTLVVDNAGGHLMQHGLVDLVIVGTDRTTANGDVCNKIGTYLKAVAAKDCGVPFYVGAPSSSIDFELEDGLAEIPIEERGEDEITHMTGLTADARIETIRITGAGTKAANYAFDVTPARLVSGLITERGVVAANAKALAAAFPERVARRARREAR